MASVNVIVDRAIRAAGIPIDGVSMGDPVNRATWIVNFTAAATPAQKATAATLLTTIAVDATAQAAQDQLDAQAFIDALPIGFKAILLALIDETNRLRAALTVLGAPNLPTVTNPQAIAAVRAKAGQL